MKTAQHLNAIKTAALRRGLSWVMALSLTFAVMAPTPAKADAPSSGVPFTKALADAQNVAGLRNAWKVFVAKGESMEPQFGSTSIILAATTPFEALKPGMVVVYKDGTGDLVAHKLVELTNTGWMVKGLNNDKIDPYRVTQGNLQGVVFGIFNYKAGTENLAALDINNKPAVALAKKY